MEFCFQTTYVRKWYPNKNYTANNITPTNDAKSHDRFPIEPHSRRRKVPRSKLRIRSVEKSRVSCRWCSARRRGEYKRAKCLVNGQSPCGWWYIPSHRFLRAIVEDHKLTRNDVIVFRSLVQTQIYRHFLAKHTFHNHRCKFPWRDLLTP